MFSAALDGGSKQGGGGGSGVPVHYEQTVRGRRLPCAALPPAGQAPRMAHTVASGDRSRRHRNDVCTRQNSVYRASLVSGAYSSLMSLPAVPRVVGEGGSGGERGRGGGGEGEGER